ncbi:hypothetical protein BLSTO_05780 [Blastocystis sp. subtype 1]
MNVKTVKSGHTPFSFSSYGFAYSLDNQAFQCIATVESVWARVWIVSYYQDVIKYCGEKWSKRYQNLMKVPCVIDEVDVMEFYKRQVGKTSAINVEIKDRKPVEYGGFHYGGECVWEYEIEGKASY